MLAVEQPVDETLGPGAEGGTARAATMADRTAMTSECSSPPNQEGSHQEGREKMAATPTINEVSRIPRLNKTSTSMSRY